MAVEFTDNQHAAIEWRREDACVLAGPGSGKTTVLVERYRRLIHEHRFEPREILAITFTEKAAANMKAKVAEQFKTHPAILRELESAWVSTIHGFCARLLRENAIAANLDPRFRVLDARESDELQFECIHTALDEFVATHRDEALGLIAALQIPHMAGDLKDAYDAIRSAGLSLADVRSMPPPLPAADVAALRQALEPLLDWSGKLTPNQRTHQSELRDWASHMTLTFGETTPINLQTVPMPYRPGLRSFREIFNACTVDGHVARFRGFIFDVFARFEHLYGQRKAAASTLDFNDLERHAIRLLESNRALRERVRGQFRQVMLDEFQDINRQQWKLINLVRAEDVFFGVGDINQSIYGFRHARPDIFTDWRAEVLAAGKHSADLLENFRSRAEILRGVEAILNQEEGIHPRKLTAAKDFAPKDGPSIEVLRIERQDRDEAAALEARWIAHKILSLHRSRRRSNDDAAYDFADFAILCRNGESMRPILDALGHAGIPYVCGRRESFLLSREGRDITALLRVIANPRDSISLVTVLRSPLARVSDEGLLRLRLLAQSVTGGLNLCAREPERLRDFDPPDAAALGRFARDLRRWRSEQPVLPLDLLITRALRDCGFEWTANVDSYLHAARTRGEGRSLPDFLREIESLEDALSSESDLSDRDQGDRVQIMTAHGAKGLEFPVVIVAAMDKGTRTGVSAISFTPEHGLGVRWKGPNGKAVEDSWQTNNAAVAEQREKQEGNRLLYVAMTRAGEHLILSHSRTGNKKSHWVKVIEKLPDIAPFVTSEEPPATHYASDADLADAVVVPPVETAGQHDSAISVTSLAVFAECPRKYYIGRYVGWSAPRRAAANGHWQETPAADLGSMVHEILAGVPNGSGAGDYPAEAHRLADVFRSGELGAKAAAASRAEREWEFIADIDGTLVRGTIDLWFEDAGQLGIVDYKTDAEVRVDGYRSQLALYAIALERATGIRPSKAHLHFLRSDKVVEVPLDDSLLAESRALIGRVREAQNALRFDMNPGQHCHSCAYYRGHCPAIIETSP